MIEDYFSGEAVAVGMQPRAGQTQNDIANLNGAAVDDVVGFDNANAEASHIVIAGLVEVGQNRRFAADQSAIRFHAAVADAFDQFANQRGIVLWQSEIIEKQERFAAGAKAIVDRHGYEVDANRIV